jgi:hypothetical protein
MATVTRTFLVDDLDGSTEDVENVRIVSTERPSRST